MIGSAPARWGRVGWQQWVVLAVILAVALAVRLVHLGTFPNTVNPDEADFMQDALRILHGAPRENGFFGFDWTPEPAYSIYLMAAVMRIFGETIAAARLPSAVLSVAELAPFFVLLRRRFPAWIALCATFLLATNLWFLHFSRSAWNNVQISLYLLLAMLCFLLALDRLRKPGWQTWAWFAAAGVCAALGLYGYFAGRGIILALLAFLPVALRFERGARRRLIAGYATAGAVSLCLFMPELIYILRHLQVFNERSGAVLLFNNADFQHHPMIATARQIWNNTTAFWLGSVNNNPRYTPVGEPLLEPLTGSLALFGMICSLAFAKLRRQQETWLWWAMLVVPWAFTEVLTNRTPDGARGVGWMPVLLYFTALGMQVIVGWANRGDRRLARAATVAIGIATVLVGAAQVRHYAAWQALPGTREARQPYVTLAEFPEWIASVEQRAAHRASPMNTGDWRASHPLAAAARGAAGGFAPQLAPASRWPAPSLTIGAEGLGAGQLSQPRSVAVDAAGNVYVADADPRVQAIKKFDASGRFVGSWGGPGEGDGRFSGIWAVAVDPQGRILVLDEATQWVQVFDAAGKFLTKWAGPQAHLYHPRALAVARDGKVYVADTGGKRIVVYDGQGQRLAEYGDAAAGLPPAQQLREPAGLAVLPSGQLFVADAPADLIRGFDGAGQPGTSWSFGSAPSLDGPRLATGPGGDIYATLPSMCLVAHYSAAGRLLGTAGSCERRDYLSFPSAVTVDAAGRLYVADLDRGVVQVFDG